MVFARGLRRDLQESSLKFFAGISEVKLLLLFFTSCFPHFDLKRRFLMRFIDFQAKSCLSAKAGRVSMVILI